MAQFDVPPAADLRAMAEGGAADALGDGGDVLAAEEGDGARDAGDAGDADLGGGFDAEERRALTGGGLAHSFAAAAGHRSSAPLGARSARSHPLTRGRRRPVPRSSPAVNPAPMAFEFFAGYATATPDGPAGGPGGADCLWAACRLLGIGGRLPGSLRGADSETGRSQEARPDLVTTGGDSLTRLGRELR